MSVDGQFDRIEQEIESLRDDLETCHRAITGSRVAIWGGAVVLIAAFTIVRSLETPTVIFGAIAAIIGGIVWYGANKSTREGLEERIADVESRKSGLFDSVAARNGWRDLTPTIH